MRAVVMTSVVLRRVRNCLFIIIIIIIIIIQSLASQTPHLLNHRRWCHLDKTLKTYCELANRQNIRVWNSHRLHALQYAAQLGLYQTTSYDRLILSNSLATY